MSIRMRCNELQSKADRVKRFVRSNISDKRKADCFLMYFDGSTVREIAEQLGISHAYVAVLVESVLEEYESYNRSCLGSDLVVDSDLSARAKNALVDAGYVTMSSVHEFLDDGGKVSKLQGVGRHTAAEILNHFNVAV